MDHDESQISRLTSKPRVHFGSLEGQESVKRVRLDEAVTASSGGIDLDALGNIANVVDSN
jgi:U4/U6 small nuclear ribonucleoprotein PRP4